MLRSSHTRFKHVSIAGFFILALIASSGRGYSQNTQPGAARQVRIMQVETATLASLDILATQTDVGAVSLAVSLAELRARPTALKALTTWVYEGGVVFLHTDAAQLFGYRTIAAREATARVAGQLFGRAQAALPFAGHPLLWGAPATSGVVQRTVGGADTGTRPAAATGTPGTLGVRLVYYQMTPGDRLVLEHPAGVPLLLVTDLAVPTNTPQYAAAIAPYGYGWAIFTPTLVEQHRADGAVFVQNLLRLMGSSPKVVGLANPAGAANMLTSLPASFIESAAERMRQVQNGAFDTAALTRELTTAWRPAPATLVADEASGVQIPRPDAVAKLMLTQGELTTLANLINVSAANAAARPRVAAMLYLLRARLEMQRSDLRLADSWLTLADQAAPATAETALWRGVLLAGQAEDKLQDSRTRATLLNAAATRWTAALGATTLTGAPASAAPVNVADAEAEGGAIARSVGLGATISGIPVSLIRLWTTAAANSANLTASEPPLVTVFGTPANSLALRHFADDPTLRLALPAAQTQAATTGTFGWSVPAEEILIFPTSEYYEGYRRASGVAAGSRPNPMTQYGDVDGNRILMVSQMSIPIIIPAAPGRPSRRVMMGSSTPAVIARLHAHVLINGLAEGGTSVPEWMQLGLMSLSNTQMQSEILETNINEQELGRLANAGGLLNPEQYRGAPTRTIVGSLYEAQAARLMTFFYARFGAGRVVETLQRLGAGETIDQALGATVEMTETEFFTAWYNAEFENG